MADGKRDPGLWFLVGLGLQLAVVMLAAVALGKWLDARLGCTPYGTLGISMAALAVTLYANLKDVLK